MPDIQA
jgi:hypothetical protein